MVIFHSFLYVYQRVSTIFYPMTHDPVALAVPPPSKQLEMASDSNDPVLRCRVKICTYTWKYLHIHTYTYIHIQTCVYIYIHTLHTYIYIYMILYNIHAHNAHIYIYIHRRGMTWPYVCKSIWYKKSCNQLHPTCQKMGTCQENRRLRETTGPVDHATPTRTSLAGTHHGSHKLHGEWTWDLFYHLVI